MPTSFTPAPPLTRNLARRNPLTRATSGVRALIARRSTDNATRQGAPIVVAVGVGWSIHLFNREVP
ncbi:hypothetical protein [Saccharothrix deserti]|uniref:hypothetical protein n=1 Tax=Saccharothrix deserti TaxID=2593674 RepID=UPI00131DB060|nr:hypothetical protein [Saccharothrix deserti]